MEKHLREQQQEKTHLAQCLEIIQENIRLYEDKESRYKKEVTELFQAVKKGEGDSYGMLVAGRNILEHTQNSLRKNRAASQKAYFGRVDYQDETYGVAESLYIGKNGITQNSNDVIIVDWRAPVSLHFKASSIATLIACALSGAGRIPSTRANCTAATKKKSHSFFKQ